MESAEFTEEVQLQVGERRSILTSDPSGLGSYLNSDDENFENLDRVRCSTIVSEASSVSTKSEREKVEEFTLRRNIERLRVFYSLLQFGMYCLITGVLLTVLTEVLWRLIPAGPVSEGIISALAALAWCLTSVTVVVVSTCPTGELDVDTFVLSRPGLSARFALLPLGTGAMRVMEFPFPRWISVIVGLVWLIQGCVGCVGRKKCRWLQKLRFTNLMQLWYLDVIVSATVNEVNMDEPGIGTSIWLVFHSAVVIMAMCCLHWRRRFRERNTVSFYVASYLTLTWNSSYFACRAIDLSLGHKDWEEGRQEDIAIMAAITFAVLILLPMLFAVLVGQRHLFHALTSWINHSRSRRLQDGAFLAMLLDSYVVEVGQPWWLTEKEAPAPQLNGATPQEIQDSRQASRSSSNIELPYDEARPGFVKGTVISVLDDGTSFAVRLPRAAETFQVPRGQEVLPWPALLNLGRKKLRCVEWAALSPEVLAQNAPDFTNFALSRPVGRGETIDFFVSHSWSDSATRKWRALQLLVENFYQKNGRYPTFWIDKFCIDQADLADGLRVLPVNVMSCRKLLCLSGKTYHTRLWCAWEMCVLTSFMSMEMALKQIVLFALSESSLTQLTVFDCARARCYNPNEEYRLRRVIEAIGKHRFEVKIRALGQLLLDRDINGDGLLTAGASGTLSFATSSESEVSAAPRPPSKIFAPPENQTLESDPMVVVQL